MAKKALIGPMLQRAWHYAVKTFISQLIIIVLSVRMKHSFVCRAISSAYID